MKRYIMIGAPVTNVRTPPLLKSFLAKLGTDAKVETRHIEPADLDTFMQSIGPDTTVDGLLVTMPHKKAIISFLETISDTARFVGSVNAVKRLTSGKLVGAQFDGVALVDALLAKGVPVGSARVLLAGVGGAGLAIAQAITAHGCQSLVIADTNSELLDAAIESLRNECHCPVSAMRDPGRDAYDLLINATPLGMRDDDSSPFDEGSVADASWVADIVADPAQTRLAAMARTAQATLITGRDMVEGQVKPIGRWLLSQDVEQ